MGIEKKAALVCVVVLALLFGIGLANRDERPGTETGRAARGDDAQGAILLPSQPASATRDAVVDGPGKSAVEPVVIRPDAAATPLYREVVVRSGDNFWDIAKRELGNGGRHGEIASANPGVDSRRLRVGQKLRVPASATPAARKKADVALSKPASDATETAREHRVKRGETLSTIAQKTLGRSSRWREIWEANRSLVPDPARMRPGIVLRIP